MSRQRVINECKSDLNQIYKVYGVFLSVLLASLFMIWGAYGVGASVLAFVFGLVVWNFVEYAIHRWGFHEDHPSMPWNYITFDLHMYHHGRAKDLDYIPVPLRFSFSVMLLLFGVFFAVTQSLQLALCATMAVNLNYLYFEWIHNRIHTVEPANKVEQWIHDFHLHHHFGDQKSNFGLTYPLTDMLFGTAKLKSTVQRAKRTGAA